MISTKKYLFILLGFLIAIMYLNSASVLAEDRQNRTSDSYYVEEVSYRYIDEDTEEVFKEEKRDIFRKAGLSYTATLAEDWEHASRNNGLIEERIEGEQGKTYMLDLEHPNNILKIESLSENSEENVIQVYYKAYHLTGYYTTYATVTYIDEDTDLAVVKIKKIGLPVVKFANSEDIVVGKQVIAIGTPITFSLRNSATVGHISGLNRSVGEPYRLVQTDTAITHGNSGGALINMNGELVGITSSGYSGTNTNFAVPVDTVKYVLNQFELYGKVRHISFGAEFQEDWLAELGVPSEAGLTIKGLEKSSPLAKASFKTGDVLVSVDDVAINSIVELNELMKNYLPGDTVKVGVKTNGEIKYADIVLDEKAKTE